jgi:hypothetical protein
VVLANTRPYEGLVTATAAAAALFWWRHKRRRKFAELISIRNVAPFVAVLGLGAALTGYYNYRVTGSPVVMPYTAYSRQYDVVPVFLILPTRKPPTYHHDVLAKHMNYVDVQEYRRHRGNPLRNVFDLTLEFRNYCSSLLLVPVAIGILFSGRKALIACFIGVALCAGVLVETYIQTHYLAPGAGLFALLGSLGLRVMRTRAGTLGMPLVLLFTAVGCGHAVADAQHFFITGTIKNTRAVAAELVSKHAGKHVVLVRYAPAHDTRDDSVFNAADIDASPVIWARDMGDAKNRELRDYYPDRTFWLWQPDVAPDAIKPY